MRTHHIEQATTHEAASDARRFVGQALERWDQDELIDDAQLVGSELVTNALLHADSEIDVLLRPLDDGVRIEVCDASARLPLPSGDGDSERMTGRGLQLVEALAARWGVERTDEGKVVWAELCDGGQDPDQEQGEDEVLGLWPDEPELPSGGSLQRVVLRDVPVALLLEARAHTDSLVREFALAAAGAEAGLTTAVPRELADLLTTVTNAFGDARHAMEGQARAAEQQGQETVDVELRLPRAAADAAQRYLEALEAADAHCRAQRLLTLETPARHRTFRRWYIEEIVDQLEGER